MAISNNAIASQAVKSGTYTAKEPKLVSELWRMITPSDKSLTKDFTSTEFAVALQKVKPGKALDPDHIFPELILPVIKL